MQVVQYLFTSVTIIWWCSYYIIIKVIMEISSSTATRFLFKNKFVICNERVINTKWHHHAWYQVHQPIKFVIYFTRLTSPNFTWTGLQHGSTSDRHSILAKAVVLMPRHVRHGPTFPAHTKTQGKDLATDTSSCLLDGPVSAWTWKNIVRFHQIAFWEEPRTRSDPTFPSSVLDPGFPGGPFRGGDPKKLVSPPQKKLANPPPKKKIAPSARTVLSSFSLSPSIPRITQNPSDH